MNFIDDHRKIKILFIIDFIYGLKGGTENQLFKLIQHLDKNKFNLYLLSLRNTKWITDNRDNIECNIKTFNIIKLKNPLNIFWFFLIVRYIKVLKPNIVMTFFPLSNILGVIAARIAQVRIIVSTRRDYGLWLNRWALFFLKIANRFVKSIVTNSQSVMKLVSAKENVDISKIDVIYNGIDALQYQKSINSLKALKEELGLLQSDKVVCIVGGLRPMKKHETLLYAAKEILKVRSDVHFIIVGNGPLRKDLENKSANLGINRHTHFVGAQEDILPFLSISDISVNCSGNEGLSNAIMEYMASGVPCIVSDAGGNPELIKNGVNGYIFELDNDKELSELIVNLLQDKKKQEEFAFKSKEIIMSKFGLGRMINAYDNFFTYIYNSQ